MKTRFVSIMIALLTGAIGVLLVYMYVQRVETSTTEGLAKAPVVFATQHLPSGVTGMEVIQSGAVEVRQIPQAYVEPGAFSSLEEIAGLVLVTDIPAGGQLAESRFAGSEKRAFFEGFPAGTEALALPMEHISKGVAGRVQPGDSINAFVTIPSQGGRDSGSIGELQGVDGITSDATFEGVGGETFLLVRDIKIAEIPTSAEGARIVVLAVTPEQASLLIHGQETAKLWFTLAPVEEEKEAS